MADEILAARISELFGVNETPNQNSDIDSDYYDDFGKDEKEAGPLQISIPFFEEENDKKIELVLEEKVVFTMRNLNPKDVLITTEKSETLPTTIETTLSTTEEPPETSTQLTTTQMDETDKLEATTTEMSFSFSTEADDLATTTILPTEEPKPTTVQPSSTTKIFSVDFLPKRNRMKSNKTVSSQLKIVPDRNKDRPRKQKTTANSTKLVQSKPYKLNKDYQISKSNRTRVNLKQRKLVTTTTEDATATASSTTQKPFSWLPPNWRIDQSKEKPILVRFWKNQPLTEESSQDQESNQRKNSRKFTEKFFREEALKT